MFEPVRVKRHRLLGALRASRGGRALRKSSLAEPLKRAAQAAVSPREFIRGYRYAQKLRPPATTEPPFERAVDANPLEEYFEALTEGPGLWKWRHYFDIYHRHLAPFRGQAVNVVEIGIYSGGSLGMWADYFGPRCHVYGVDIAPECVAYNSATVTVFIGDQADPAFWARLLAKVPAIDVVIDDGGHRAYQQIATLEALLPHIRPGGVYVCEDIDGPFQPFLSFVDGLTRPVSDARWGPRNTMQRHIASVHRYPLITVIEKAVGALPHFESPHHGTEWQPFLTTDGAVHGDESASTRAP